MEQEDKQEDTTKTWSWTSTPTWPLEERILKGNIGWKKWQRFYQSRQFVYKSAKTRDQICASVLQFVAPWKISKCLKVRPPPPLRPWITHWRQKYWTEVLTERNDRRFLLKWHGCYTYSLRCSHSVSHLRKTGANAKNQNVCEICYFRVDALFKGYPHQRRIGIRHELSGRIAIEM